MTPTDPKTPSFRRTLFVLLAILLSCDVARAESNCKEVKMGGCSFIVCDGFAECCEGGVSIDIELIPGTCAK